MLNLHSQYAPYWHKASFQRGFIHKLWKYILIAHLPWKFGNVICDCKVFVAHSHTFISISVLWIKIKAYSEGSVSVNVHHYNDTPFWSCNFFQGLQCLGNIQQFLFEAKVVLISAAAVLQALWHTMMPNPSYCTSQNVLQKQDLWNIFFNEFFCPECMLRSLDGIGPACINYLGGMLADVQDGHWWPINHWAR